jgi:hypothetical protein
MRFTLLAASLLVACAEPSEPIGATSAAATTIWDLTDQGSWEGRHYFELWGSFPGSDYFMRVVCNGVEVPSRREYHAAGQINVSIPEPPRDSSCSFFVGHAIPGGVELVPEGLVPRLVRRAPLDVVGVNDQGVYQGKRYFELYGKLDGANQTVDVTCNGVPKPTTISWPGTGQPGNYQINIAISQFPSADWTCDVVVHGGFGVMGQASAPFHFEAALPHAMPDFLGVYHWGNNEVWPGQSQIGVGAEHVREAGFQHIRVVLTPRVRGELVQGNRASLPYQFDRDAFRCSDGKRFLACAALSPEYDAVLADPAFRTVILTAYDSVANGDGGWSAGFVDLAFMVDLDNRTAMTEEYRQLGYELQKRHAGSGKTFVISNWEADNSVYCGGVYGWSTNANNVRATCPSSQVWRQASAMKLWFELRRDAIRAGVAAAERDGFHGVTVADGIEFSSYTLDIADGPRVLDYIVTGVKPSFALYSSYDTINRLLNGATQDQVTKELRAIKQKLALWSPGTRLVVGEAGYNVDTDARQVPTTVTMARAIHAADIWPATLWVGYDSMPACDAASGVCRSIVDGFFHADGGERWILKNLRNALSGLSALPRLRIDQVQATPPAGDQAILRLWGHFPGGESSSYRYHVRLTCNGQVLDVEPTVTTQSLSFLQASVARPATPGTRRCKAAVYRVGASTRNDDFTQSNLSAEVSWTW